MLTYDEIIMSVPSGRSARKRISGRTKRKTNVERGKSGKAPAICLFACADGTVPLVLVIFPTANLKRGDEAKDFPLRSPSYHKRGSIRMIYAFNSTGRMNGDLWKDLMRKFVDIWETQNPGLECRLQGDRLGAHMDVTTVHYLAQHRIRCVWPSAKTTNFTAPLDDVSFGNLKNSLINWAEQKTNLLATHRGNLTPEITAAIPALITETLTPAVVKASFAHTGTWPWNPDLIRKRAQDSVKPEKPPASPSSDLYKSIVSLVTPTKVSRPVRKTTLRVQTNQVFTSEQLFDEHKRVEAAQLLAREQGEAKRRQVASRRARDLEDLEAKGAAKRLRMASKGDSESQNWRDQAWLDGNTCRACAKVDKGKGKWTAPDCGAFWYCATCVGKARWKIDAHQEECKTCQNEQNSE
jgi:hypothetical protein